MQELFNNIYGARKAEIEIELTKIYNKSSKLSPLDIAHLYFDYLKTLQDEEEIYAKCFLAAKFGISI